MKEIIEKIVETINKKEKTDEKEGCFFEFSDSRYKPINISRENFKEIKKISSDRKIAFIDGGNAEILKSSSFSLQLIRAFNVIYQKNKKLKTETREFFVLVRSFNKDGNIHYKAEIFPLKNHEEHGDSLKKEDLIFNSFDETIKQGIFRANISKIGEIARRFAELRLASDLIDELDEGDIIVIDGTLQISVTNENKYFSEIYKKALEKKVIISALAKTTDLFTNNGNSAIDALNEIAPGEVWYYWPVAVVDNPGHKAEIHFIKLNKKSKHIFRFEVFKENKFDINEILSLLVENSKDPVFLGYPYGLINADRFARVSNKEKEYFRTAVMAKAGKDWQKIEQSLSSLNAHDVLDMIS